MIPQGLNFFKKEQESSPPEPAPPVIESCLVCYEDVDQIRVSLCSCEVPICNYCVFQWAKTQLEQQMQTPEPLFVCPRRTMPDTNTDQDGAESPQQECSKISMTLILTQMESLALKNSAESQAIDWCHSLRELLLQHFLIHTSDVRICPTNGCGFAGSVQIDQSSGRIECSAPLRCEKCDASWHDPLQRLNTNILAQLWENGSSWLESLKTNLRKVAIAEPCPECGVLIQKNSGCSHMSCGKCKYEFCWQCLQSYRKYKHEEVNAKYHAQFMVISFLIYNTVALLIIAKVVTITNFSFLINMSGTLSQIWQSCNVYDVTYYGTLFILTHSAWYVGSGRGVSAQSREFKIGVATFLLCSFLSDPIYVMLQMYILDALFIVAMIPMVLTTGFFFISGVILCLIQLTTGFFFISGVILCLIQLIFQTAFLCMCMGALVLLLYFLRMKQPKRKA